MMDELRDLRKDLILQSIARNYEYSESILKWCVTSLTALNGGAIVALIGVDDLRAKVIPDAGWYFGAGVLVSVLASFLFVIAYASGAQEMAERLWRNDLLSRTSYKSIITVSSQGAWPAGVAFLLAIGSAALLVTGGLEVIDLASNAGPK